MTYLPFLWLPQIHIFLKPTAMKDCAARVGHAFADAYQNRLGLHVYASLLDLVATTETELADLLPIDRIDIQTSSG